MKRFVVLLSLIIYCFTTIGATLHFHYCMEKLVDTKLWQSNDEKCSNCGMTDKKEGCCKTDTQYVKLTINQKVLVPIIISNLQGFIISNFSNYFYSTKYFKTLKTCFSTNYDPPNTYNTKLILIICAFLI